MGKKIIPCDGDHDIPHPSSTNAEAVAKPTQAKKQQKAKQETETKVKAEPKAKAKKAAEAEAKKMEEQYQAQINKEQKKIEEGKTPIRPYRIDDFENYSNKENCCIIIKDKQGNIKHKFGKEGAPTAILIYTGTVDENGVTHYEPPKGFKGKQTSTNSCAVDAIAEQLGKKPSEIAAAMNILSTPSESFGIDFNASLEEMMRQFHTQLKDENKDRLAGGVLQLEDVRDKAVKSDIVMDDICAPVAVTSQIASLSASNHLDNQSSSTSAFPLKRSLSDSKTELDKKPKVSLKQHITKANDIPSDRKVQFNDYTFTLSVLLNGKKALGKKVSIEEIIDVITKNGVYTSINRDYSSLDLSIPELRKAHFEKVGIKCTDTTQRTNKGEKQIDTYIFEQDNRQHRTAIAELVGHNKSGGVKGSYLIKDEQGVIRVSNIRGNDVLFASNKSGSGTTEDPYTFSTGLSYIQIEKSLKDSNSSNKEQVEFLLRNLNLAERGRNDLAGILMMIGTTETGNNGLQSLSIRKNGIGGVEAMQALEGMNYTKLVKNHPNGETVGEIFGNQLTKFINEKLLINEKLPNYDTGKLPELISEILRSERPTGRNAELQGLSSSETQDIGIINPYYSKYTLELIKNILALRIDDTGLENLEILQGHYIFQENYNNISKMLNDLIKTPSGIVLVPLNLYNTNSLI